MPNLPAPSWLAYYLHKTGLMDQDDSITDDILLAIPTPDGRKLRSAWRAVRYRRAHPEVRTPGRTAERAKRAAAVAQQLESRVNPLLERLADSRTRIADLETKNRKLRSQLERLLRWRSGLPGANAPRNTSLLGVSPRKQLC